MSTAKYKAPVAGYYYCSAEVFTATPTGETETILNPDRRWWEWWKPLTKVVPVYKYETVHTGRKIVLLEQGQEIASSIGIIKI